MFGDAPPALPGVEHIEVTVRRARWHVAVAGAGQPLVLLHGWPQNWWAWRHVVPRLAERHRVYAPDLRGFGWSDAPEGRYGKAGLASDVELLLDELEIDSCVLAGHDWGGFTAFLTALRAPDRVERLAVFSMTHPWLRVPRPDLRTVGLMSYQLVLAAPVLGAAVLRSVPAFVGTILDRGAGPGFEWDREARELYVESFRRRDHALATSALYRTWLLRELPALGQGRYRNRTLAVPAVLATGEHDLAIPPHRIEGAGAHAPHMRTEAIAGAGHFLPEERPDDVARLILEG